MKRYDSQRFKEKRVSIFCKVDYNGTSTKRCVIMRSTEDNHIEMRKIQVNK